MTSGWQWIAVDTEYRFGITEGTVNENCDTLKSMENYFNYYSPHDGDNRDKSNFDSVFASINRKI